MKKYLRSWSGKQHGSLSHMRVNSRNPYRKNQSAYKRVRDSDRFHRLESE